MSQTQTDDHGTVLRCPSGHSFRKQHLDFDGSNSCPVCGQSGLTKGQPGEGKRVEPAGQVDPRKTPTLSERNSVFSRFK